jgi:hypothetical protein
VVSVELTKTRHINASGDTVFARGISGVDKVARWMPERLHKHLIQHNTTKRFDIAKCAQLDQVNKKFTWDDGEGYKGAVSVKNIGSGVEVTIRVQCEKPSIARAEVDKFLTRALKSLEKQIRSAAGPASSVN